MVDETHILVVDDDAEIRDLLRRFLAKEGYRVTVAEDAMDARNKLTYFEFDILIVDVMMPGESGLALTEALRPETTVPILMLTSMGETDARIAGLKAGADDYLAKPFEPMELILRIQSILRRSLALVENDPLMQDDHAIKLGTAIFDMEREILLQGEAAIKLTTTEIALLKALAEVRGAVMSREDLCERSKVDFAGRTVDVQVTRLRRKIEPDPKNPRYLRTVRGQGYVLRPDS